MNQYQAKFERERKTRPSDWIMRARPDGSVDLINIYGKEKKNGAAETTSNN